MNGARPLAIVVFSKEGCHLCEAVEEEIRSRRMAARLRVVDIDGDPTLQAKYLTRVPVVVVDGKEIFEAMTMDPGGRWKKILAGALE